MSGRQKNGVASPVPSPRDASLGKVPKLPGKPPQGGENGLKAWRLCVSFRREPGEERHDHSSPWRWVMLAILSVDICVSYIPYYTFVPIGRQSMQVYGVDEAALNVACILYALVFVPAAFVTGPLVGAIGSRWTFVVAMASQCVGCFIRIGPLAAERLQTHWRELVFGSVQFSGTPTISMGDVSGSATPLTVSFWWVIIGQAFCAMGQPLLVNCTSEMGAEWFPPHERPTAAMVSNLMNFIGGSLSFVLPPLIVSETHLSVQAAEKEVTDLLECQLWVSLTAFAVTLLFYRAAPSGRWHNAARSGASCLMDVMVIFRSVDFWLVNGYFIVYIALAHAFDAVEGSLLEHYGYNASLTSWTAIACGIGSILSTWFEVQFITSARAYRGALLGAAAFLAVSQALCFVGLFFRLPSGVFICAVGIMGLATPGWGCSCELGAEVCYPAREATVSSILEAFSNLAGVLGIIVVQWLIDAGYGASVLILLGCAATAGGCLLICLSGRLHRTEAEEAEAEDNRELSDVAELMPEKVVADEQPSTQTPAHALAGPPFISWFGKGRARSSAAVAWTFAVCFFCFFCRILLFLPESQLPENLSLLDTPQQLLPGVADLQAALAPAVTTNAQDALSQAFPPVASKVERVNGVPQKHTLRDKPVRAFFPEPVNFVISCNARNSKRLKRFERHMKDAGLDFEVVQCVKGTPSEARAAVLEGLIGAQAMYALSGFTAKGMQRSAVIGRAITHIRLLSRIVGGNSTVANVFEDAEVVVPHYKERRAEMLLRLPANLDVVKMNVKHPAGRKVAFSPKGKTHYDYQHQRWSRASMFRMISTLSPTLNVGMTNYMVTQKGAKKILKWSKSYDSYGKWESWDQYLLSKYYKDAKARGWCGFTVSADVLSMNCNDPNHWQVLGKVEACRLP